MENTVTISLKEYEKLKEAKDAAETFSMCEDVIYIKIAESYYYRETIFAKKGDEALAFLTGRILYYSKQSDDFRKENNELEQRLKRRRLF